MTVNYTARFHGIRRADLLEYLAERERECREHITWHQNRLADSASPPAFPEFNRDALARFCALAEQLVSIQTDVQTGEADARGAELRRQSML